MIFLIIFSTKLNVLILYLETIRKINNIVNTLISVIIPTFNRASTLKKAIESVIKQTYSDWEVILVDNSSTDNTLEILEEFNNINIKLLTVNNNGVIGYSRNVGIEHCSGKYIAFLDSDDWWDCEKLSESVLLLESSNIDVVYHNCQFISDQSTGDTHCRRLSKEAFSDLIINGNTLVTSSTVVLKSAIVDAGCFSEDKEVNGWEDYHLWMRLAEANVQFGLIKKSLGFCRKDGDNFDTPQRVLLNLIEIEKYIHQNHSSVVQLRHIWWIDYARGRAHMRADYTNNSNKFFLNVVINKSPLEYKIKALYFLIKLALYRRSQKKV